MTTNQRFVLLLAGMTLAGIAWTKAAPTQPQAIPPVIQARAFQVVDAHGTVVIELKVTDDGSGMTRQPTGAPRNRFWRSWVSLYGIHDRQNGWERSSANLFATRRVV